MKNPASLFSVFPVFFLLASLAGCSAGAEKDAELKELRAELAVLEKRIEEERAALEVARERYEEGKKAAETVREAFAVVGTEMVWRNGTPTVTGRFLNDSTLSVSSASLLVTLVDGINVLRKETMRLDFDPILLPEARAPFALEASSFVWGFREEEQRGMRRFRITRVGLANGKTLEDDFDAVQRLQGEVSAREQEVKGLRLEHGAIYTRIKTSAAP